MGSETILILGGSGKTGRRVAERLSAKGKDVRLASRSTVPAFDWTDPSGWAAALDGADAPMSAISRTLLCQVLSRRSVRSAGWRPKRV